MNDDDDNLKDIQFDFQFSELDEELDNIKFNDQVSTASCFIKDIKYIMFGGFSSRFWMHRKDIISTPIKEQHKIPFLSWQCLTLVTSTRYIDLVIKDEQDMEKIIKYLIFSMKTVDGKRDSAVPILEALNAQAIDQLKQKQGIKPITSAQIFDIT